MLKSLVNLRPLEEDNGPDSEIRKGLGLLSGVWVLEEPLKDELEEEV